MIGKTFAVNNIVPVLFRSVPVGPEQMLLRGAHLRNTQWIFGELIDHTP